MTSNNNIDEKLVNALQTIHEFCTGRKHKCEDCPMANALNQCLIYEYPYLWQVKPKVVVKLLADDISE